MDLHRYAWTFFGHAFWHAFWHAFGMLCCMLLLCFLACVWHVLFYVLLVCFLKCFWHVFKHVFDVFVCYMFLVCILCLCFVCTFFAFVRFFSLLGASHALHERFWVVLVVFFWRVAAPGARFWRLEWSREGLGGSKRLLVLAHG